MKRSALRKVSKKQAKRNMGLRTRKEVVLNAMHERWGTVFCMALGTKSYKKYELSIMPGCGGGSLDWDHVIPRSRGGDDSFENCQILCRVHHRYKTVTPGMYDKDFRNEEMKKFMAELDSI